MSCQVGTLVVAQLDGYTIAPDYFSLKRDYVQAEPLL